MDFTFFTINQIKLFPTKFGVSVPPDNNPLNQNNFKDVMKMIYFVLVQLFKFVMYTSPWY